jgi:DNA invertase Pin-like site-specific DNA recombinase
MYLRVSTKEQAEEGYSIAAQAEACRRYIADRGWELVEEFVDRGESARTADRPQFRAMLSRLTDDGSIDHLVIHKLDRLARNLEDHAQVRALLRKADVQLVSVTESLEDTASGKLVEGILASIAEFYSANLSQEIRKGIGQKVKEGGWPTHAPIGYRNVRAEAVGGRRAQAVLQPDEQAHLVVHAFRQFATGRHTVRSLNAQLSKKGLRNRRGGPVTTSGLHSMLRNPVYIDKVVWKGAEYEGAHDPLIDSDLFDKVQAIMDSHSTGGDRSWKHDHYLKGTLYCGECGSRLYYLVAKGRFGYFRCVGVNTARKQCSQAGYMSARTIEREVEKLYEKLKIPPQLEQKIERTLMREETESEKHRAEATVFIGRRLKQVANERDRLLKAYYAEAIDVPTLKREQARINTEQAQLEAQLAREGASLEETKKIIGLALRLAKSCRDGYPKGGPERRRLWNQAFYEKIVVKDGKVKRFRYAEPFAYLFGSHKRSIVEVRRHYQNRFPTLKALVEGGAA